MIVRRLNDAGIAAFMAFLDSQTTSSPLPVPVHLLTGPQFSTDYMPESRVEVRSFDSQYELAEYLFHAFAGSDYAAVERDRGLWAWLGLFYFEVFCKRKGSRFIPGAAARWVPELRYDRYYRHLLAGPFRIYRAHRDNPGRALALLCNRPGTMGDIVEQLASRQELVTNQAIVGAATALYVDPDTRRARRGAGGKGAGSPRRLSTVIGQLDLTYDLRSMSERDLLELLPQEFNRWKDDHSGQKKGRNTAQTK